MCTLRRSPAGHRQARSALGLAVLLLAAPLAAAQEGPQPLPPGAAAALAAQGGRGVEQLRATEPPPPPAASAPAAPRPAAAPAAEPAAVTDFQRYAGTSVGGLLPLFGHDLFRGPPSTFAAVDDLPASAEHLIGPGDELVIRGWGQVELDVRATVSREGTIGLPRVGLVSVAGVPFRELEGKLRAAVGRYYKDFELGVSLGRLRSIQVFVVGHALRPGLYTVGSLSTLMNALFAAGGPAPTGSLRRIELRRGDRLVGEFDLYDLLLRGDKSKDLRLQAADVIFIPSVGPQAAVAGRVKTPAIFELHGETTLGDLVAFAGGLTTTADGHSVQLERLDPVRGRVVQELPWSEASLATPLKDGDVARLRPLSQKFANAVTLRGNVAFPLRTEWRPGLTVSGLIPDRGALLPERYWERIAARGNAAPPREATRAEATARGGEGGTAALKVEVENLVEEVNWDYAVVERLDRARLEPVLLPFNLGKALLERDPAHDLALEPGDVVTVFSQRDILSPAGRRTAFVRVEGEVATPGFYQVRPGETLRQLVARAGGLAGGAYLFGAEFTRESVRREQQARLDQVALRAEQELEYAATERLSRAGTAEEAAATRAQLEAQRGTLARLRTLKASGRMVLEVAPTADAVDDLPPLVLEDGDRLFLPHRSSTVGVYGAVHHQATFLHRPEKRLDDYLAQAGGPTRAADADGTYVLRADGSVVSRRQSGWFQSFGGTVLMPNDAVVVPEDYAPVSWVRELKDWSQIFYQFGLGVAALTVLFP